MRSNKWLILSLVLSMAVNIALIGFFAGRASHGPPLRSPDPTVGFMRILPNLDDARRAELRPLVGAHMRAVMPNVRQLRRAQREMRNVIAADPFDAGALEAALEALRGHLGATQVASHAAFVKLVSALTPEERRLLIEVLQSRPDRPRFPPGRGRPGGKMAPTNLESSRVDHRSPYPVRHRLSDRLPAPDGDFRSPVALALRVR